MYGVSETRERKTGQSLGMRCHQSVTEEDIRTELERKCRAVMTQDKAGERGSEDVHPLVDINQERDRERREIVNNKH